MTKKSSVWHFCVKKGKVMSNVSIQGIYSSKSVLDTAEAPTAKAGDAYLVGSKMPYELYIFKNGSFRKSGKVSDDSKDLGMSLSVSDLMDLTFSDNGQMYKLRRTVGRGAQCGSYELFGVK